MKMIVLLHPQGFTYTPTRYVNTYSTKPFQVVSTKGRSIKSGIKETKKL